MEGVGLLLEFRFKEPFDLLYGLAVPISHLTHMGASAGIISLFYGK